MLKNLLLSAVTLACLGASVTAKARSWNCLPDGIKATDVVSTLPVRSAGGGREFRKTTVAQKLAELKARCRKGKLVDSSGTEIRFYKLQGCWGYPSDEHREILEKQTRELEELKKHYRVITMTCNPSGEPIPSVRPVP
jgi:hypothetical protein